MERYKAFSKLDRMQALAERDCVENLRFMATRLNRLKGEILDLADECDKAIANDDMSQTITNLYLASGAIERGTTGMLEKLSRLIGCIDAMHRLRSSINETKNSAD